LKLKAAPDPFARAGAMRELAKLLDVRDSVLLTSPNQHLVIQTWRDNESGFSPLREIKQVDKPADLLEPLAPKPIPKQKDPDPPPFKRPVVVKKWWQKKRYWAIGATALGVLVGSVVAYSRWDREIGVFTDTTFPLPGTARQ
jgi:hypothetical protein